MTYYNRVVIGGTGVVGEVWSVGLNYNAEPGIYGFGDLQQWANAIAEFLETAPNVGMYSGLSVQAAISQVRVEYRGPEEQLVQAAEALLTPPKTGINQPTKIPQACVCFSLLTGRPGRSYRGRIYWPAYSYANTTSMRFPSTDLTTWINQVIALNTEIENSAAIADPLASIQLAVRSRLLHSNQLVTAIAAGDVPDVQRRRRDDLVEVYQQVTLP